MFTTIYLPDFYLQAALRQQSDLAGKPVALIHDREKKAVIIQLNAAAEESGVRRGMTPVLMVPDSIERLATATRSSKQVCGRPALSTGL